MAELGLLFLDQSLRPIALDRGAAMMLDYTRRPGFKPDPQSQIPREILNFLRNRKPTDPPSESSTFHIGRNEYSFRAYFLEAYDGYSMQPIVALHLKKVASASDSVYEVAAKYNLTDREREVLRGISMGLPNKTLGEHMGISPNTIKSFQRLIMLKLGVRTRAEIIARILQNEPQVETLRHVEKLAG